MMQNAVLPMINGLGADSKKLPLPPTSRFIRMRRIEEATAVPRPAEQRPRDANTPTLGPNLVGKTGIAFSGGGSRAYGFSAGVLRALQSKNAINKADVISGVSGGGWATAVFLYNQTSSLDEILDQRRVAYAKDPTLITTENLTALPPTSMLYAVTQSFLRTYLAALCCKWGVRENWLWAIATWRYFFKPYGIGQDKYFAHDDAQASQLSTEFDVPREDFTVQNPYATPIALFNVAMVGPAEGVMTQRCSAISQFFEQAKRANTRTYEIYNAASGSKTMDQSAEEARAEVNGVSFAYYSISPYFFSTSFESGPMNVSSCEGGANSVTVVATSLQPQELVYNTACHAPRKLSLEWAVGAGWAATIYAALTAGGCFRCVLDFLRSFQPEWPLPAADASATNSMSRTAYFADAGDVENHGIASLLRLGTSKIFSVVSSSTDEVVQPNIELLSLFGLPPPAPADAPPGPDRFIGARNQVFARKWYKMVRMQLLGAQKEGRAQVAVLEGVPIEPNSYYGLPLFAGQTVDLTFLFLSSPTEFTELVPAEVLRDPQLADFPFFKTIGENKRCCGSFAHCGRPTTISYEPQQLNLLSDLGCWSVLNEWRRIAPIFGLDG